MTMSNREKSTVAHHQDKFASKFQDVDVDEEYEASISYEDGVTEDTKEGYGPVEERGSVIDLEHPADSASELPRKSHLQAQLRRANLQRAGQDWNFADDLDSDEVAAKFDTALLDVAEFALASEGVVLGDIDVANRYVKAVFLHDAWDYDSKPKLEAELKTRSEIADRIGFDSVPDQSMFARVEDDLEEYRSEIEHAAIQAVYAVLRVPIPVPDSVKEAHAPMFSKKVNERKADFDDRQTALRNWVRTLLDETVVPFDFDYKQGASDLVLPFFGLYAHCALQGAGFSTGRNTARTMFPDGDVPSGSGLKKRIFDCELPHLRNEFRGVHDRFFQVASTYGFNSSPRSVAFDPTVENWYGEDDSWTVGSNRNSNAEVWFFAGLGITDLESRFALGLHPVASKTNTTEHMERFLSFASQHFDVDSIYADGEFYDSSAVETCDLLTDGWIIRAKDKGEVADLLEETPEGEIGRKPNIDLSGCSIQPNAFVVPTPDRSRSTSQTRAAYITGYSLDEANIFDLHSEYDERRSIEPLYDQIKNDFHIETKSAERKARFFYINTAMLFYNMHTLINRAPDPEFAFRLDVTHQRVLSAIRDVTIGHYTLS
jgi:hypothetical protein